MESSPFSLQGRVALITGGSRGIGKASALMFAKAGADVVVAGLEPEELENVAAEVKALGRKSLAVEVDVTDSAQIHACVERATKELGPIDILVNNAGIHLTQRFTEGSEAAWSKVIQVNLLAQAEFARAVVSGMMERGSGKIVFVASDAGRSGSTGQAVYGASKGGVMALTRNLAAELARYNINVNCVSPGLVNTNMWNATRRDKPKLAAAYEKTIPFKRLGEPEEIASAILFLSSEGASYVTGQILSVNGGVFIG